MIKLSRTKIELFLSCPRCFWLEVKKGIKRPPPAPYTINSAIDNLLKKEFDVCRLKGAKHCIMEKFDIDAIPYRSDKIDTWRNNFTGIQFLHQPTDFLVFGAIDDVWINPNGELIIVDYKATGANEYKIYDSYKRQIEVYQWLFKQNGYKVCSLGYFLFAKVNKEKGFAAGNLSFDLSVEPCYGDSSWVEGVLPQVKKILQADVPEYKEECLYCQYSKNSIIK